MLWDQFWDHSGFSGPIHIPAGRLESWWAQHSRAGDQGLEGIMFFTNTFVTGKKGLWKG